MKKILIFTILLSLLITSCNNNLNSENSSENQNNKNIDNQYSAKDYYPFSKDKKYIYEGIGNEFASYTVYTDYISDDRIQKRTNNGGTETIDVVEYKDGELRIIKSRPETYFRQSFINTTDNDNIILLKEPLKVGNSWTSGDMTSKITSINSEVVTPSGTYNALEVTSDTKNGKTIEYYVKDIGLVKTIYQDNDYEVTSMLSNIENNSPLIQNITFFYPNTDIVNLNTINIQITFNTNEDPIDIIEKNIKDLSAYKIINSNTKINSMGYDEEKSSAYIDFSKEFITNMNAEAALEILTLQSITNTMGVYYSVDNVYITIDGEPYKSEHIDMKKDQPFTINFENTISQ